MHRYFLPWFPRSVDSAIAGLKEAKNLAGKVLRLIQDRLSDAEFGKNLANLSTNSPQARIADSSSINAVSNSSARTMKRFPSPLRDASP
jgi:hypothetical protein